MPRKPRLYLPDVPSHVIQRGNNRSATFFVEDDYRFYLKTLKAACTKYDVRLHAYVLMTNHVHLLMTPREETGISRVMQSIGRCYVQYINKTYRRTGTLWEGRHKANLIQAERYLLYCYRYIELNPVNANMVEHPGNYRWSSYQHNALGQSDLLLTEHSVYLELGVNKKECQKNYRELFKVPLSSDTVCSIRKAADFAVPLGSDRFREEIENTLGKSVGNTKRGRPPKKEHDQDENNS